MKVIIILFTLVLVISYTAAQDNPIKPFSLNPAYWQYNGQPLLLLGGSDDDNLFQWTGEDLIKQLEILREAGGNYIRGTMSYRDEGNAAPWVSMEDGRYDLSRFNNEFWDRFSTCLKECAARDIIVQVEVWATYDYFTTWENSTFNPENNINFSAENTTMPGTYDPGTWPGEPDNTFPFYYTIPELNNDQTVLRFQQEYIDKLLSVSLEFDNVLYCIDNEVWTNCPWEWGWYWSRYIKEKAREKEKTVNVTEMYCFPGFDVRYGHRGMTQIKGTLEHPEIYDYLDISNIGMFSGELFFRQIYEIHYRVHRQDPVRPVNFVKLYGNPETTYDLARASNGVEAFWISIFSGMASARFHRPPTGIGISEMAQTTIRAIRSVEKIIQPWNCKPMMELTSDNYQNEAYLIANPGKVYAVYFPKTHLDGEINVDLRDADGGLSLRWLNADSGEWTAISSISGGDWRRISIPEQETEYGWVAVLLNE